MSASMSSPTITVSPASASSAARAASKYAAARLPNDLRLDAAAYSSPATKAPASRAALEVCHQRFRCRRNEARPPPAQRRRGSDSRTRRRGRSRPSRRRHRQHSVGPVLDERRGSRGRADGRHRQREHACPRGACRRRAAWSRSRPPRARCRSRGARRERARARGVVGDEAQAVASSRRAGTASGAPGIGSPETWRTPSMSRRMAAIGASLFRSRHVAWPARGGRARYSRSSGPGGQHAQKTETRVEAVFDVEASEALTGRRSGGSYPARDRSCARSPRTSAASGETASWPSTGWRRGPRRSESSEAPSHEADRRRARAAPERRSGSRPKRLRNRHERRLGDAAPRCRPRREDSRAGRRSLCVCGFVGSDQVCHALTGRPNPGD